MASTDWDERAWQRDINSFGRLKALYYSFTTDVAKENVLKRCRDIQGRWPQYIKIDELPRN